MTHEAGPQVKTVKYDVIKPQLAPATTSLARVKLTFNSYMSVHHVSSISLSLLTKPAHEAHSLIAHLNSTPRTTSRVCTAFYSSQGGQWYSRYCTLTQPSALVLKKHPLSSASSSLHWRDKVHCSAAKAAPLDVAASQDVSFRFCWHASEPYRTLVVGLTGNGASHHLHVCVCILLFLSDPSEMSWSHQ